MLNKITDGSGSKYYWFYSSGSAGLNTHVKEVVLSSNVTTIPNYAFKNYTALEKVTANGNISSIGENAFYGCSNVTFNFKGSYPAGYPWGAE